MTDWKASGRFWQNLPVDSFLLVGSSVPLTELDFTSERKEPGARKAKSLRKEFGGFSQVVERWLESSTGRNVIPWWKLLGGRKEAKTPKTAGEMKILANLPEKNLVDSFRW